MLARQTDWVNESNVSMGQWIHELIDPLTRYLLRQGQLSLHFRFAAPPGRRDRAAIVEPVYAFQCAGTAQSDRHTPATAPQTRLNCVHFRMFSSMSRRDEVP